MNVECERWCGTHTYDGVDEAQDEIIGYPIHDEVTWEVVFIEPYLGGMREGLFDRCAKHYANLAEP